MKEIFTQLLTIWHERNPLQKMVCLGVFFIIVVSLSMLLLKNTTSRFEPLYPDRHLTPLESNEIRCYLQELSIPFKEDKKKGILVLSDQADQVRYALIESGVFKREKGKGFELFDTNTWIKGEKELQVLEMRALKGQLEKDLTAFEPIKSANVILDIPPQKSFNGQKLQTKASVILTLMPKAHLSFSTLRAITNHLTGAVRGLEPNMIAISDTSGKLYKAIDPNADQDTGKDSELFFEDLIENKISALLCRLVGEEHFHTSVQAVIDKEAQKPLTFSIAVAIDKEIFAEPDAISLEKEITRQLTALASGYKADTAIVVDFIPFCKKGKSHIEDKKRSNKIGFLLTIFFVIAILISLVPFLRRYKKNQEEDQEALFRTMTRMDLDTLAASIQSEDPQTIALMLSYLEPVRAEKLIAALNIELQQKVLFHLSELEKND